MKANEFFKKYGLVKSRGIIGLMTAGVVNYDGDSVDYNDLKRLVESHELVEKLGGLDEAKIYVPDGYKSERLKQAIADVESCQ